MRVLHISADFPDPLVPGKTQAVANLLSIAPEHEHVVYSLNRVSWRRHVAVLPFGPGNRAIAYGALPYGLRLREGLAPVAAAIIEDASRRGFRPDVVHAHKLSVEGLVAGVVAPALGGTLMISTMGDTDLKFLGAKRGLRSLWRDLWRNARVVTAPAPWTVAALEGLLGPRPETVTVMPYPTMQDDIRPPREAGPLVRSTFHLASWRRKNALALIGATRLASRRVPEFRLEIIGGGSAEGFAAIAEEAARADGRVRLLGPLPHDRIGEALNEAGGFALASRRESFGMVYIEALMAGSPIVHSAGAGVDGLFEADFPALRVDPTDVDSIADGLCRLVTDEKALKSRLSIAQRDGSLERFRRAGVASCYRSLLAKAATASCSMAAPA